MNYIQEKQDVKLYDVSAVYLEKLGTWRKNH